MLRNNCFMRMRRLRRRAQIISLPPNNENGAGKVQTITRKEPLQGVGLTCIQTDKFKTGCLTINIISGLARETAAYNALLPQVLRRGAEKHPDMDSIAAALDELYGARIEPMVRKKGELHSIGFYADFPDDRFIPGAREAKPARSILEETAALLGELLLSPCMDDGLLRADYIESEKSNLIDDIRAAINDKRGYSIDRLVEEMCAGEPYGVSKLGSEDEARKITPETLTAHYNNLIRSSRIEAFYCGCADPEAAEAALVLALGALPKREIAAAPKTGVALRPPQSPPRRFTEELDVTQGKLTVGFRLGEAMETPSYPVMMVFNAVYGGSLTSKLFMNVRERLSLCYYASSMLDKHKGVMLVASGVDFSKIDTALEEMLAQLDNVKKGEVSDWELAAAKSYIITSLQLAMDRSGGLEEMYFDSSVSAIPYDPMGLCAEIESVTTESVTRFASGIEPDSIFTLTGKDGEADEL